MKISFRIFFLFSCIMALGHASFGQHFLSTNGQAIVNENQDTVLLRGMGLGGWMLQEGYMLQTASFANSQHKIREKIEELIGTASTDQFYEAWLANHVRKSDIDSLKSWGFNSVRLPMHYNLFTLPIEDEPQAGQNTWLTKGFELTDSLIAWCKQNEMYVILDLHAAPGGQGMDEGISDYDPDKPSLWESQANQDKTVALWKRLAERYAQEEWVAGYDLINETNWNMTGNIPLKELYKRITDSIRLVDTQHILFIEGNWFANDFTGLTPPWDDNLVYAPHKYWSFNDQASIQWVLNIRDNFNVPIYFGESGENSNVWFRDAIRLLEDNKIGWAWWPMKKVESIAGPLSVIKPPGYQALLDYWGGNGSMPNVSAAKATLMQLTTALKTENCEFHKDVIDAMFRQVYSDQTIPFKNQQIPGVVYATDFDMGVVGEAYYDVEVANYQVSTGNYTSWNTGWAYRNDGVDIEVCTDNINSNGYNVGWLDKGEWMQYDVTVAGNAVYDVQMRVASNEQGGHFHFAVGDADISIPYYVPVTGGWQNWQTIVVPNVILDTTVTKLRMVVDGSTFNLNSFEFIEKGPTSSVNCDFVSAVTFDEQTIQLNVNKNLQAVPAVSMFDFEVYDDGLVIPVINIESDPANPRIIYLTVDYTMNASETIRVTYSGDQIMADDGTLLENFYQKDVLNTLILVHDVPGKIEAEDYSFQSGVQLETTTDVGGGQNIGYLDPADYLDYEIDVQVGGTYQVGFRTASLDATGAIDLQLIDDSGNASLLGSVSFAPTGGWQSWSSTQEIISLPEGRHRLRVLITQSPFNMNWMSFAFLTATESVDEEVFDCSVFPNPGDGLFTLSFGQDITKEVQVRVFSVLGNCLKTEKISNAEGRNHKLDLSGLSNGIYLVEVKTHDGRSRVLRVLKAG